jgi:hypothetical protein
MCHLIDGKTRSCFPLNPAVSNYYNHRTIIIMHVCSSVCVPVYCFGHRSLALDIILCEDEDDVEWVEVSPRVITSFLFSGSGVGGLLTMLRSRK